MASKYAMQGEGKGGLSIFGPNNECIQTLDPVSEPESSDPILYGHDPTGRIVAVHPVMDDADGRSVVHIYRRSEDDTVVLHSGAPLWPFFHLSDASLLRGLDRSSFRLKELEGDLFYRFLVVFSSWRVYRDALRHVERRAQEDGTSDPTYSIASAAQQYLTQTGRTLFKDLHIDDLHRFQLDIECISAKGFPNAERKSDRIILVACSDNRGWREVLGGPDWDEKRLLLRTVDLIRRMDPDVIEGHNLYRFDFPYLMARCRMHGVRFGIGRDGSEPRTFASSTRFAERALDYIALDIAGRHVIDTFFLVLSYDMIKRDLPGYGLKEVSRHFGFAPPDRTYVEGSKISALWKSDPEKLRRYALDDVIETERLARHLSESTFYLTQMVPMPYGRVARTGPAAKIESLFVREYLRQKHSLPRSEWGNQSAGGYTDIFFTGVTGPIVYADVESLYPSIMLRYDVRPSGDRIGAFPRLLELLTRLRLRTKADMNAAETDELRSALDARQNSYKIVINSFYGFLGFSRALFNDYSEADRVARTGQEILLSIMKAIDGSGGQVIEVDTDGVLFVPPSDVRGREQEQAFLDGLGAGLPEGIRLGFDGRYERMLSYKKKNYALLDYEGHVTMKGSSLVSRSVEPFARQFVRRAIPMLLQSDIAGLHELYLDARSAIIEHEWKNALEFCRTETLKDTPESYARDVAAGKRPRSAAYELALASGKRGSQRLRKGDRVSWYVSGSDTSGPAFETARPAPAWDPAHPDENTAYYLKRLSEMASRFEGFFRGRDFRSIFSEEDLFGFDPSGITLLETARPIPESLAPPAPEPDDDEEF